MPGAFSRLLRSFGRRTGILQVRCPACGVPAPADRADGLCPGCAAALAPREGGFCPGCGAMFGLESYEPALCGDCRAAPPPWGRFIFHARYDDPLRGLIIAFKYNAGLEHSALLRSMAASAWERAVNQPSEFAPPPRRPDLVAPVPLHGKRLLWRGFNQSLELASAVAARAGAPLEPAALQRLRDTRPQSTLSGSERLTNLHGAFEADAALVGGKWALLVDDVCTTGSTLRECAKSLLEAGAKAVDVLVLARA